MTSALRTMASCIVSIPLAAAATWSLVSYVPSEAWDAIRHQLHILCSFIGARKDPLFPWAWLVLGCIVYVVPYVVITLAITEVLSHPPGGRRVSRWHGFSRFAVRCVLVVALLPIMVGAVRILTAVGVLQWIEMRVLSGTWGKVCGAISVGIMHTGLVLIWEATCIKVIVRCSRRVHDNDCSRTRKSG